MGHRGRPIVGFLLLVLAAGLGAEPVHAQVFPTPTRSTTIALTSDDTRLIVVNREANTVSVLRVRTGTGEDRAQKLAEIPVGIEPRCVAVSPNNQEAYVTNGVSGTVSVVALAGANVFRVVAEIPTGGTEPRGCALTPTGAILYVANHTDGTVSVINTATRQIIRKVSVGGNPMAIAITNNGDAVDSDELVFVTRFFAERRPGGGGEGFDNGRQGIVRSFQVGETGFAVTTLSPVANAGFTASRRFFCTQFDDVPPIHSDLFCPNPTTLNPDDPTITSVPQGAFPNQLFSALIRGNRLYIPSIGAGPEPPVQFNTNVQALVHVVNTLTRLELSTRTVNLNQDVAQEAVPANPVGRLRRLFGNDIVAIDADRAGTRFLIVSRGGNFVFRARLLGDGRLSLNPPDVVRYRTGNLPSGVVVSGDGLRAYVNNEVDRSVTRINLETSAVIPGDIPSSEPPAPGTIEHAVAVGKLAFFTALGLPDNGVFGSPIRALVPLQHRGKASRDGWSSCGSCHPDGLTDNVTWIFGTGPRKTLALDAFFSKRNPADQRISNWSAIMGSITDFNNNSRGVQGGCGFASDDFAPPGTCNTTFAATAQHPGIFQHGLTQGASDALDAMTLWVQTVRPLVMPQPSATLLNPGRVVFGASCASCHGGAKWTKSQVIYDNNPTFASNPDPAPPGVPPAPLDPGVTNARAQIRSFTEGADTLQFLENVGTFDSTNPREIRGAGRTADQLGRTAVGALGFNPPSLLGVRYHAPYLHDGGALNLDAVFARHALGGGTIASQLTGQQIQDLKRFLNAIDGRTGTFDSETDEFLDSLFP